MWYRNPDWHGFWWGPFMGIVMILLILLAIGLVVWALLRSSRQQPSAGPVTPPAPPGTPRLGPDPAVEQARMRYAKGEIDRDQFLRIVGDLSGGGESDLPRGGPEKPPSASPTPA
jgi:uncharacterized membrane protein